MCTRILHFDWNSPEHSRINLNLLNNKLHGNVKYRINQWNYLYIAILYFHLTLCEFITLLIYGDGKENKNKKRKEKRKHLSNTKRSTIKYCAIGFSGIVILKAENRYLIWFILSHSLSVTHIAWFDLWWLPLWNPLNSMFSFFLDFLKLQRFGINHSKMPFQKTID